MKSLKLALILFSTCSIFSFAEDSSVPTAAALKIEKAVLCEKVVKREPEGANESLLVKPGKIFFWNLILGAKTPSSIKHVWLYQGKTMAEITLQVKYARFRTWSSKTISAKQAGDWKVKAVDETGTTLKEVDFKVGA